MSELDHEEMTGLVAAYALDAVDPADAVLVERHLQGCAHCSAELQGFREVTGLLANSGGDASGDIWHAISQSIERPGQQDLQNFRRLLPPGSHGRVEGARRDNAGRWPRRLWMLGSAAAIAVIAALSVQVARLDHHVSELQTSGTQEAISGAASRAMNDPLARRIVLDAAHSSGPPLAEIVILPSGMAFLINRALPPLPDAETYQLWGQIRTGLVSLGLLGSSPQDVAFRVDPGVTPASYAVTAEHAGGVVRSTRSPVAVSPSSP